MNGKGEMILALEQTIIEVRKSKEKQFVCAIVQYRADEQRYVCDLHTV